MSITVFSVVGLGKLGASMAAAIASRGFDVVGVDVSDRVVDLVNRGRAPVTETGLAELIAANTQRFNATTSHLDAVLASDATFVVVPTPSEDDGSFSITYVAEAFEEIGSALASKNGYHLIVLTSTVLPGATRFGLLPILEERSGKRCGVDFGLCYSPEFIALGSVIHDFLNPDFLMIGESDGRAGDVLQSCYAQIVENAAPCKRMSFENAELAKIALNSYVTTKITFANMLADLCERLPEGDVDVVSDALGLDRRVGRAYLTGGLGYGGPCFPRDNAAFATFARSVGTRAPLAEATHQANEVVLQRLLDRIRPFVSAGTTVAVLGLAYKPFSDVVEESQGLALAKTLAENGTDVIVYDPLASSAVRAELDGAVRVARSVEQAMASADVVVIATPDPAFADISFAKLEAARVAVVVDCWRLLDAGAISSELRHVAIGHAPRSDILSERLRRVWSRDIGAVAHLRVT